MVEHFRFDQQQGQTEMKVRENWSMSELQMEISSCNPTAACTICSSRRTENDGPDPATVLHLNNL